MASVAWWSFSILLVLDDHARIALGTVLTGRHTTDHAFLVHAAVDQMIADCHRAVIGTATRFAEFGRTDYPGDNDLALFALDSLHPVANTAVERFATSLAEIGSIVFKTQHHGFGTTFNAQARGDFLGALDLYLNIVVAATGRSSAAQTTGVSLQRRRTALLRLQFCHFAFEFFDLGALAAIVALQLRGIGRTAVGRIDLIRRGAGTAALHLYLALGDQLVDTHLGQLL